MSEINVRKGVLETELLLSHVCSTAPCESPSSLTAQVPVALGALRKPPKWQRRGIELQWMGEVNLAPDSVSLRSLRVNPTLLASACLLWRLELRFQKRDILQAGSLWFLHTYTGMHIKGLAESLSQNPTEVSVMSKFNCRSLRQQHPQLPKSRSCCTRLITGIHSAEGSETQSRLYIIPKSLNATSRATALLSSKADTSY